MKRNLFTLVICTALVLGLFSCGGGDVTKSKEQLQWQTKLGIDTMMASAWAWEKYLSNNPL